MNELKIKVNKFRFISIIIGIFSTIINFIIYKNNKNKRNLYSFIIAALSTIILTGVETEKNFKPIEE